MQTALRPLKALKAPPVNAHWQLIRDQKVREAEVKADIEVRRLEEKAKVFVERKGEVETELRRAGEAEAGVKAHQTLARWWGTGFAFACVITMMTALWTLNWYLTLTWERALVALTIVILPIIGWAVFLLVGKVEVPWKVIRGLGLTVVLFAGIASALLGAGRMAGVLMEETRQQAAPASTELGSAGDPEPGVQVARVKKLLFVATMVSVILLAVAGEIAAGLAFHEYYRHMTVVRTVWPFYREQAALSQAIADNLALQEEVRRQPEILHAQLTAEGLEAEAHKIANAEAEVRAAAAKAEADAQARSEAERRANSLGRVVWIVLVASLAAVILLLGVAVYVFAAERHVTVVILDLSASTASEEFTKNVQAVEGIIERLEPEARFVVLGVSEGSFSAPPLFVKTSPRNSGRFGEHLSAVRMAAIREWRVVASSLRPDAKGSDLIGALARASTEFGEVPGASKTLILLSDMRQVGRGLNLENGRARPVLGALEQRGLVARLDGVAVWMLGVQTAGIDIGQWHDLKAFWSQYFRKAGATVKTFSPSRRAPAS